MEGKSLRSGAKALPPGRSLPAAGTACLCSQALELSSYTEPTLTLHDNRRETKRSRIWICSAPPFRKDRWTWAANSDGGYHHNKFPGGSGWL